MKILISESQLSLITEHLYGTNLDILDKQVEKMNPSVGAHIKYKIGKDGIEYGGFTIHGSRATGNVSFYMTREGLQQKRNWFNAISMGPVCIKKFIDESGVQPDEINCWSSKMAVHKRYQSNDFQNYCMELLGDMYDVKLHKYGVVLTKKI